MDEGTASQLPTPTVQIEVENGVPASSGDTKKEMRRKECITCCIEVAINQYPKDPHKSVAPHNRDICFNCWEKHLAIEDESKTYLDVCCASCDQKLDEVTIRRLASRTTYQKWLDKASKDVLDKSKEFHSCPLNCGSEGFLPKDHNIFQCPECSYRHCVECNAPMHDGETCASNQERIRREIEEDERKRTIAKQNEASRMEVETTSKGCPNCTSRITKNGGCDHMTCRRCMHEFCWECFTSYHGSEGVRQMGNSAHATSCPHHSARLPDLPRATFIPLEALGFQDRN